jgi:hypothetical protein
MSLAETGTSVNKKRIEILCRLFGYGECRLISEFVVLSDYEIVEIKTRMEIVLFIQNEFFTWL